MNRVFLLTGGNLGNRSQNLQHAAQLVQEQCGIVGPVSGVYQTAAWGHTGQPDFYNQALQLQTHLDPDSLMQALLHIEAAMGRQRILKMGPRTIDIDILLMNDWVYRSDSLTIPHPRLTERRFVLTPLAEIAGEVVHPVLGKTIQELLELCTDDLPVHKI